MTYPRAHLVDAENGGDAGWFTHDEVAGPMGDAVLSLGDGEVSEVLDTGNGLYLLMVEEREPERQLSYEEARKRIRGELLSGQEAQNQLIERLSGLALGLEKNAPLKILPEPEAE